MSKSVVRNAGSMDGAVKGLDDTNLMEPPLQRMIALVRLGGARVKP
jgi:hypothetical protein